MRDPRLARRLAQIKARPFLEAAAPYLDSITAGHRHPQARCPFHADDTPSFTCYDDHGHCHGCGWTGDHVKFVQRVTGFDFTEAVERLEFHFGIDDEDPNGPPPAAPSPRPSGPPKAGPRLESARLRRIHDDWRQKGGHDGLVVPSEWLGIPLRGLHAIDAVPVPGDPFAVAFPMYFPDGRGGWVFSGIRLRYATRKSSVPGSRNGYFRSVVPTDSSVAGTSGNLLLITEGPTDAASVAALGFDVIGRSCALGGIRGLEKLTVGRDVVVIGDNDEVGKEGMRRAARACLATAERVRCLLPSPAYSDIREEILQRGLDRAALLARIACSADVGATEAI